MLTIAPECWLDLAIAKRALAICGAEDVTYEKGKTFADSISKLFMPSATRIISVVDAVKNENQKHRNKYYQQLSEVHATNYSLLTKRVATKEAYLIEFELTAENWIREFIPESYFKKHNVIRDLESRKGSAHTYNELAAMLDDAFRNTEPGKAVVQLFRDLLPT